MSDDKGHYRQYRDIKFSQDKLDLIGAINNVLDYYSGRGIVMSLRGVYYQLVAKNIIPNNKTSYINLGGLVSDGRLAGHISWTALDDPGRRLSGLRTFTSPREALRSTIKNYKLDMWANQDFRLEVWVEKQGMETTIAGICNRLRVDFFATKGYNSQSAQWRAGQRFARYIRNGQRPVILHMGDHDPSGLDMTGDIKSRIEMFVGMPVMVQRLALNWDQIEKYNPPPQPGKWTDSRMRKYEERFGTDKSWEMDALNPDILSDLIEDAVIRLRDQSKWDEMMSQETGDIRAMEQMAEEMSEGGDDGDDDEP